MLDVCVVSPHPVLKMKNVLFIFGYKVNKDYDTTESEGWGDLYKGCVVHSLLLQNKQTNKENHRVE